MPTSAYLARMLLKSGKAEICNQLHPCRKKQTKGRRTIRSQHYTIQPRDELLFDKEVYSSKGCYCNGTRVMLDSGKSVAIKK